MQQQQRRLRGRRAWRQLLLPSGRDGFRGAESLRQPIASQDLGRAVEVSRHLGNLVVVEEEEVMVTELGGEVEVDLEERKTLMC